MEITTDDGHSRGPKCKGGLTKHGGNDKMQVFELRERTLR